ncbi:MAG: transketolase [Acidimicrobiales bacterium]
MTTTGAAKRHSHDDIPELQEQARVIRTHVVRMVARHGQGYVQQGLGAADMFTALLFHELRLDENNPGWPDRDRFFLSTSHNSALFHAAFAERGFLSLGDLETYCVDGSPLEINVSERLHPIVEATCGSLGQGLSVAAGMALSAKRQGLDNRFYVVLGDGELQEGQVWEAAIFAAHWKLDNLCLIVDDNDMQVEGSPAIVTGVTSIAKKFEAFGWHGIDIDGNNMGELLHGFDGARQTKDQPTVINAKTLVGKGVPFLEGQRSHNMVLPADAAELALSILEG